MMKAPLFILCGAALALSAAVPAFAHHSGAMFDRNKEVTLKGTIKELQWTNPHSWIEVMVPDATGKLVQWSFEMEGPNVMHRQGWNAKTIKPGDAVTIVGHPLKDGRSGGSYVSITLPDGKVLGRGATPRATEG
jgi:hypothetical protein